jgi:hypothetical protein
MQAIAGGVAASPLDSMARHDGRQRGPAGCKQLDRDTVI